jgi:hypothetical protein
MLERSTSLNNTYYTYYLYHKSTDRHYYGARYRKGCDPTDLWTSYFSSSSVVHQLIQEYGKDSFVSEVRKIFQTAEEAIRWETRLLSRIDAQHNDKWINRHNGRTAFIGPHLHSDKTKNKIRAKIQGLKRTEETKDKMSISAKRREDKRRAEGWTMPAEAKIRAIATRQERINSGQINPYSKDRNQKMAQSKKGTKRQYLPDGSFVMVRV